MKNLKTFVVLVAAVFAPSAAFADEFDITMDVVGAEESFDEVIVNRIALPFSQSSSDRAEMRDRAAVGADVLDEVSSVVDGQLSSAEVGDSMVIEPAVEMGALPK
ncbi:MAG: hypothetical protein ACSHXK_15480 [Oceanococcus sp.]